ncbi:MAG: hypothetical protein AB7S75_14755 [Desulfococcaceae bacterium]
MNSNGKTLIAPRILTFGAGLLILWAFAAGAFAGDDFEKLKGRWQRPDGGYVLEIRSVKSNGDMDAAYFNPNPIHVAVSRASQADGVMRILIELRDVNYPGSLYNLLYDPKEDILRGTYYQAVHKETYEVHFVRLKP